ncbi:P1 family peptidase [Hyphomicrobium sp.]|uniref:DmpA family aminopeptidase n=1 Tax=Hyphomicrobium sp. TaxID=82 RepID=UPI000FB7E414|nr:P1 family peptidase [Hyphomicrobium sp.]RUP00492.1 MAG: S58 family peptidase [Hyphomicrobium sp.]
MTDTAATRDPAKYASNGKPRARGLGLPMPGVTGPANAITDVAGVTVGLTTLRNDGGSVHTGVTAILPRAPQDLAHPVWAGVFSMNGNGEMTGSHWIRDAGWFTGPITITNTFSVGLAHHATLKWMAKRFSALGEDLWALPVAAETYDGFLSDIAGFHITEEHVIAAIDGARPGPVAEGCVGGGTGMIAYEFKGGTGTASRRATTRLGEHTIGVLVQANHGIKPWLTVCGKPVGDLLPGERVYSMERGSIIVIIATDAPLLPGQLERLARRASIGIGRGGTPSGNSSGDIFMAFSTANDPGQLPEPPALKFTAASNDDLDSIYLAVVESVEEAVINAMLAAETTTGKHGRIVKAIDGEKLKALVLG